MFVHPHPYRRPYNLRADKSRLSIDFAPDFWDDERPDPAGSDDLDTHVRGLLAEVAAACYIIATQDKIPQ